MISICFRNGTGNGIGYQSVCVGLSVGMLKGALRPCRALRKQRISTSMILSQFLIFFLTDRHRATILPFLFIYESYACLARWAGTFKAVQTGFSDGRSAHYLCGMIFPPQNMAQAQVTFYRATKSGAVYDERKTSSRRGSNSSRWSCAPRTTNAMYNLAIRAATGELALAQGYEMTAEP